MTQEQSDSDRRIAGPGGEIEGTLADGPQPQQGLDYDALLQRYGESMLRIGHLEAQVSQMSRQLEESASQRGGAQSASPFPESQSLRVLAELVDSLQKLIPESPQVSTIRETSLSDGEKPQVDVQQERSREDEFQQMRVQVSSLSSQLASAETRLKEIQSQRNRRRRRTAHDRSWWKKTARRLVPGGARFE